MVCELQSFGGDVVWGCGIYGRLELFMLHASSPFRDSGARGVLVGRVVLFCGDEDVFVMKGG